MPRTPKRAPRSMPRSSGGMPRSSHGNVRTYEDGYRDGIAAASRGTSRGRETFNIENEDFELPRRPLPTSRTEVLNGRRTPERRMLGREQVSTRERDTFGQFERESPRESLRGLPTRRRFGR